MWKQQEERKGPEGERRYQEREIVSQYKYQYHMRDQPVDYEEWGLWWEEKQRPEKAVQYDEGRYKECIARLEKTKVRRIYMPAKVYKTVYKTGKRENKLRKISRLRRKRVLINQYFNFRAIL